MAHLRPRLATTDHISKHVTRDGNSRSVRYSACAKSARFCTEKTKVGSCYNQGVKSRNSNRESAAIKPDDIAFPAPKCTPYALDQYHSRQSVASEPVGEWSASEGPTYKNTKRDVPDASEATSDASHVSHSTPKTACRRQAESRAAGSL